MTINPISGDLYPVMEIYQTENGYILQVDSDFFCYYSLRELTDAVINKMPARKHTHECMG